MNIMMMRNFLIGLISLLLVSTAHAAEAELTDLVDFKADGVEAKTKNLPLLLMFSASYCGYCTIIKEEFLKPMKISGDYTNKIIVRVLELDSGDDIIDIDGKKIDPVDLAERYNVQLTPTLIFVDSQGKELVQKMVGVTTVDFYGGYLDDAIDNSLLQLRNGHELTQTDSTTRF